jgi:hypothetical protein
VGTDTFLLFAEARLYPIAADDTPLIAQALFPQRVFGMSRIELEDIVNARIVAIVVLLRHLKWIKSREGGTRTRSVKDNYK